MDFSTHRYANNVNDNVFSKENNNDNVNVDKSKTVDLLADRLVSTFNNPKARALYCSFAWKLPEAKIWYNVESAQRGDNPPALFTWLCKRDMR